MARTPIHPGEVLADELVEIEMSAATVARELHVPPRRLARVISGNAPITAEFALRLGHWFGTGPELWMNLQKQYELRLAEQEVGREIRETINTRPTG